MTKEYTLFSNNDLKRLLVPLVIEQALFMTVGAADSMMVAFLGEASVSSVAMVDMLVNFICNIFFALSTGGAVVASQYLGARDRKNARDSASQLLIVTGVFAIAVMIVVELFNRPILRSIFGDLDADVMDKSVLYLRIVAFSFPFISIYGGCAALFRSQNMAKITMYISLISSLVNVCGNSILIFGFDMGVAGAAYATVVARFAGMVISFVLLTNTHNDIYVTFKDGLKLSWGLIRRILYIGIPSGIENGIFQFGRLLVMGLVAGYGTSEIAANAVANTMGYFSCLTAAAFNLAIITVIGQCVGAGDEGQLRYYFRKMMKWTYICHFIWNAILFMAMPFMMLCYSRITPETRHLAWILILIHNGLGLILWPASFGIPCAMRSMNDVKFTMIVSVGSMIVIRLGLSYLIAPMIGSGAIAVWIAMIADWVVRIIFFVWRYQSNAWLPGAKLKS